MATISPVTTTPSASPLHPEIKWAQRKDRLLLTVDLHDASDVKVSFENADTLRFRGISDGTTYESDLHFYDAIDADASTYKILPRAIQINVMKKKEGDSADNSDRGGETFWPRLLKNKAMEKNKYELTVDWNRWVDEDGEDEAPVGFDWSTWQ
jgi:prostaglandin-E synthase